jgi:hypothetical protein
LLAATLLAVAWPSGADLQNVEVNGSIRIRGNWYTKPATPDDPSLANAGVRYSAGPGQPPITSIFSWDKTKGTGYAAVEQRTRLGVKADMTDNVSAYVEFDAYNNWGDGFRSANYVTGADTRANGADSVALFQAYIDADQMFGLPIHMRIGRQELQIGNGFLIGNNDTGKVFFTGLSFDAIHLSSTPVDGLTVGAIAAKTATLTGQNLGGDVDMYATYARYEGFKDQVLELLYIFNHDGRELTDTHSSGAMRWMEDQFSVNQYHNTNLNVLSARASGTKALFGAGTLDYNVEVAYELGSAGQVGSTFSLAPAGFASVYGDDRANWNTWGGNFDVGYTFDTTFTPRVHLAGLYFGGEDNRKLDFGHWLASAIDPFYKPRASVSFNRLYSGTEFSNFLDSTDLSNVWGLCPGASAVLFKNFTVNGLVQYWQSLANFNAPHDSLPSLGFWSKKNSGFLGVETLLYAHYDYTSDLAFEAGWGHFFVGDGLSKGNFNSANGLGFNGGRDNKDGDYFYGETKIKF